MRKLKTGFTLIELVVVIAILGILAAIALPKFTALQADARLAKMNAAMGSVKSAASMAHAMLIARGFDSNFTGAPGLTIEGTSVTYVNGYPDAASVVALAGLTSPDYVITGLTAPRIAASDANHTGPTPTPVTPDCSLEYTAPAAINTQPTYTMNAALGTCN